MKKRIEKTIKTQLRLPLSLHRRIQRRVQQSYGSMNQWILGAIEKALKEKSK